MKMMFVSIDKAVLSGRRRRRSRFGLCVVCPSHFSSVISSSQFENFSMQHDLLKNDIVRKIGNLFWISHRLARKTTSLSTFLFFCKYIIWYLMSSKKIH